jgi:hypothetical protein
MNKFLVHKSKLHLVMRVMLILLPVFCAAMTLYMQMPALWFVTLAMLLICVALYVNSLHSVRVDNDGITCYLFARKICAVRWDHLQCAGIETVKTAYGESKYLYFSEKPMPKQFTWSINKQYVFVSLQPGLVSCLCKMWDEKKVSYYFKQSAEADNSVKMNVIFSNARLWLLGGLLLICLVMGVVFGVAAQSWQWLAVAGLSLLGMLLMTVVLVQRKKTKK